MELQSWVTHVVREGNAAADYLAKKGIIMKAAASWNRVEDGKRLRDLIRADEFHYIRSKCVQ